jgi:predicted transcriptional regulator
VEVRMEKIDEVRARIELKDKKELELIERDIDIAIKKGRHKKMLFSALSPTIMLFIWM